ncbi:MAG: acyltransferase [Sphingomonas sp.]
MRQNFYKNLESIRGVSALMICIYHIGWSTHLRQLPFYSNLWIFVDLFFVLSGFVIALAYIDRLQIFADSRSFMKRRLFRIYPLHFVTTIAALALMGMRYLVMPADTISTYHIDSSWIPLVLSILTLTHNFGWTNNIILNIPSWSISTEFFAYIVFATTCLIVRDRKYRVALLVIAAVVSLIILLLASYSLEGPINLRVFRCLYGFGLGVLTFQIVNYFPSRIPPLLSFISQSILWITILTAISLISGNSRLLYFVPLLFAILTGVMAKDDRSGFLLLWNGRVPTFLGAISYSVYLNHGVLMTVFGSAQQRLMPFLSSKTPDSLTLWIGDGLSVIFLATTLALSFATYKFIEVPWRERGRRPGHKMPAQT